MGLLDGKTALIFGVANDHSIAWGIAQALHAEGAEVGFSSVESLIEKRVRPLADLDRVDLRGSRATSSPTSRSRASSRAGARPTTSLDILVHALAFARREDLEGGFVDTSRDGFALALDVSAYSLVALAREARPLLRRGSSVMTLTYYGAEKVVANYNVMGVAKAALEASVRYLAADLGPDGIRVNAISAGPVRTLAAAGIAGFKGMYRGFADVAPLRANITPEDVGRSAVYPRVGPLERGHRRGPVRRRRVQRHGRPDRPTDDAGTDRASPASVSVEGRASSRRSGRRSRGG